MPLKGISADRVMSGRGWSQSSVLFMSTLTSSLLCVLTRRIDAVLLLPLMKEIELLKNGMNDVLECEVRRSEIRLIDRGRGGENEEIIGHTIGANRLK